jgi:hypothetical protein
VYKTRVMRIGTLGPGPPGDPILVEGERVTVDLDVVEEGIDAVTLCFFGAEAVLAASAPPRLGELLEGGTRGMLWHRRGGRLRAVSGNVRAARSGDHMIFRSLDRFGLGQRRRHSRAPLPVELDIVPEEGGVGWTTAGADVSPGGVRIPYRPGTMPGRRYELRLDLGGSAPAEVGATVARIAPDAIGLAFDRVARDDRAVLAQRVLAWHREAIVGARAVA